MRSKSFHKSLDLAEVLSVDISAEYMNLASFIAKWVDSTVSPFTFVPGDVTAAADTIDGMVGKPGVSGRFGQRDDVVGGGPKL